jgi:hypothetical protein
MKEDEMRQIADIIVQAVKARGDEMALLKLSKRVDEICARFPLYEGAPLFGSKATSRFGAKQHVSTKANKPTRRSRRHTSTQLNSYAFFSTLCRVLFFASNTTCLAPVLQQRSILERSPRGTDGLRRGVDDFITGAPMQRTLRRLAQSFGSR